jgi:hypothetical protein
MSGDGDNNFFSLFLFEVAFFRAKVEDLKKGVG